MINETGEIAFTPSEISTVGAALGIAVDYWKEQAKLPHDAGSVALFQEQGERADRVRSDLNEFI